MSSSRIIKVPKFEESRRLIGHQQANPPIVQERLGDGEWQDNHLDSAVDEIQDSERQHAEEITENARVRADKIIEQARVEADEIQEVAFQNGYTKGLESGRKEGLDLGVTQAKESLAAETKTIKMIVEEALSTKSEILKNAELDMVRLVMEVARKVIRQELSTNPSVVAKVVTNAVQKVTEWDIVKIRVNPEDHDLLIKYWSKENEEGHLDDWEIVADKRVKTGGCIIDTKTGMVDAQIDTQLAEIKKSFEALAETGSN